MDSVGQRRMAAVHGGRRDKLEISPNLWAGVGLVRGGAGTALVGNPETVAARMKEYRPSASTRSSCRATRISRKPIGSPSWYFRALPLEQPERRGIRPCQHRAVRRNHRQRTPDAHIDIAVISVIETLPRLRTLRIPRPDGLIPWVVPLAILVVWQIACTLGLVPQRVLPAPSDVAVAGWKMLRSGELLRNIWVSFWRAGIGFLIGGASASASVLPTACRSCRGQLTDTTLQMVRNIPHLALIPLVILWFGIDETAKLFLVALGVFFPIYLNTLHGVRSVDPQLIEMGRSYGMSERELFRRVILPGALPSIFVGLRFALGIMWLTLIVAETIAA